MDIPGKRWQAPFAGTALRVLRTKGARHLFPKALNLFLPLAQEEKKVLHRDAVAMRF